jgi:hypothetical protein
MPTASVLKDDTVLDSVLLADDVADLNALDWDMVCVTIIVDNNTIIQMSSTHRQLALTTLLNMSIIYRRTCAADPLLCETLRAYYDKVRMCSVLPSIKSTHR